MRVVCGSFPRLCAEMQNLEHGARVVDPDDLRRLPEPHDSWPVVLLPPCTAEGEACTIHYRPTVGIVYYTLEAGDSIEGLVAAAAAQLERGGDAHLRRTPRAVAASPATILRHEGRVSLGANSVIAGPLKNYTACTAGRSPDDLPARLLVYMADGVTTPPAHYGCAGFTWVFMPVAAALAIGAAGFNSMAAVNATLAAIFYDGGLTSTLRDGAEVSPLTTDHFEVASLPHYLDAGGAGASGGAGVGGRRGGVLLAEPGGRLTFVGREANLHARSVWPPVGAGLGGEPQPPLESWSPGTIALRGGLATAASRDFQCVACAAPLGGEVIVARGARVPPAGQHQRCWHHGRRREGSLLAAGGLLLCTFCWGAFEAPACLTTHMGARITRTVIPYPQSSAAAACPDYRILAPLLAGTVTPLTLGAVVVRMPASTGGASVVLAGEKLGRYPAITNRAIAATGLGVLGGVSLAEVCSGADGRL